MKLQLKSDFRDYYDHMFDRTGETFERLSTGGMSRPEMFSYLKAHGFTVPSGGIVKEMSEWEKGIDTVFIIVYTDPQAHRGEGKVLCTVREALKRYPNCFYSQFFYTWRSPLSFRHLQIGNRAWILSYGSDDLWRSNCGNVEIIVTREEPAITGIEYPLFAIDSIIDSRTGIEYAVDFNIAPGIRWTGIEKVISATEVVDLIKAAIQAREPI